MHQLSDIPRFQGNESPQEAEQWLETLITSTGSFTDSGILRLITARFPSGSASRKWFDGLEGASKGTWLDFEQQFRTRWIAEAQDHADQDAAWDAFTRHNLTSDEIFREEMDDGMDASGRISTWTEDHLRLGGVTNRDDTTLIEATKLLLPPFIQAYLQVYSESSRSSFDDYCQTIMAMPTDQVKLEQIRRQISSRNQILTVEKKVEEISKEMKHLVTALKQGGLLTPGTPPTQLPLQKSQQPSDHLQIGVSSNESIAWEPCSPITSIVAMSRSSSPTTSEHPTPVVRTTSFLDQSEGTHDSLLNESIDEGEHITLFQTPNTWRKPVASVSKEALIAITKEAIDIMLQFGKTLSTSQAYNIESAFVIYQRLINSQHVLQSVSGNSRTGDRYEWLFLYIRDVRYYLTYGYLSRLNGATGYWGEIADGNRQLYWNVVTLYQTEVSNSGKKKINLRMKPSGQSMLAGGVFSWNSDWETTISSIRTILFMTLSSYLAECTGEMKYTEMAVLSANCVKTWMLDPLTTLVKECLIEATTAMETGITALSSNLTGISIEAFSILASVTGDESWRTLAIDIAMAAMHHSEWHSSDGILAVGSEGRASENTDIKAFKGLLNRGLLVAYQRNRSNKAFCNLVRSYINVQCNALLELSRYHNSYGVDWRGPYAGPYAHAQMAAIDTLVAAIGVND